MHISCSPMRPRYLHGRARHYHLSASSTTYATAVGARGLVRPRGPRDARRWHITAPLGMHARAPRCAPSRPHACAPCQCCGDHSRTYSRAGKGTGGVEYDAALVREGGPGVLGIHDGRGCRLRCATPPPGARARRAHRRARPGASAAACTRISSRRRAVKGQVGAASAGQQSRTRVGRSVGGCACAGDPHPSPAPPPATPNPRLKVVRRDSRGVSWRAPCGESGTLACARPGRAIRRAAC